MINIANMTMMKCMIQNDHEQSWFKMIICRAIINHDSEWSSFNDDSEWLWINHGSGWLSFKHDYQYLIQNDRLYQYSIMISIFSIDINIQFNNDPIFDSKWL